MPNEQTTVLFVLIASKCSHLSLINCYVLFANANCNSVTNNANLCFMLKIESEDTNSSDESSESEYELS